MTEAEIVAIILRMVLGTFMVLARFRFIYDPAWQYVYAPNGITIRHGRWFSPARRLSLTNKMIWCSFKRWPQLWAWLVALTEIIGGICLIVGVAVRFWAFAFVVLLLVATICTAKNKVMAQKPVDCIAGIECYLWTPEPLYIIMSVCVLILGGGWL